MSHLSLTTLLVVVEDVDDIDWNVYNFENSESAEELIALIQVAGPPRRIEGPVLRILRHLHHIGTTLSSRCSLWCSTSTIRSGKPRAIDSYNEAIRQKSKQPFAVRLTRC